jgi:hypothetical protein
VDSQSVSSSGTVICGICGIWGKIPEGRKSAKLQESGEFFDGQPGLPNQGAKRAFGELRMMRDGQTTVRRQPVPQDYVASGLVVNFVAQVGENTDRIKTRGNG